MSNHEPINSIQVSDYILENLIFMYSYNNERKNKSKETFDPLGNNLESCYIINSEWIQKYKDFYNYENISNIISKNNFNFGSFKQIEDNINRVIQEVKKYHVYQKGDDFKNESKMIPFFPKRIDPNINSMYYYNNFYIANKKIGERLYSIYTSMGNKLDTNDKNMNSELKYALLKNNYSLIIFGNELEIGIIDKDGIFTPNYHIRFFKEQSIINEEIRNIINRRDIEIYFKSRAINKEGPILQKLKSPKFGDVAFIFNIVKYNEEKNNKQNFSPTNNNANNNNNLNGPIDNYQNSNNKMNQNQLQPNFPGNNNPFNDKDFAYNQTNIIDNTYFFKNNNNNIKNNYHNPSANNMKTKYGFTDEEKEKTMKLLKDNNVITSIKRKNVPMNNNGVNLNNQREPTKIRRQNNQNQITNNYKNENKFIYHKKIQGNQNINNNNRMNNSQQPNSHPQYLIII